MQPNDRVRKRRTGTEGVVIGATPADKYVYVRLDSGRVERWRRAEVEVMA